MSKVTNIIGRMKEKLVESWPYVCGKSPDDILKCLEEAIVEPRTDRVQTAIQASNEALAKALQNAQVQTSARYRNFLLQSLEGSAGPAHALIKS